MQFPVDILPFTLFSVTIRCYTYWGTSRQTTGKIHSPQSVPSEPLNLRTFVEYENHFSSIGDIVSIIVRWDPPNKPNGILLGYEIKCWQTENLSETDICDGITTEANQLEYRLIHMDKNQVYKFQVSLSS